MTTGKHHATTTIAGLSFQAMRQLMVHEADEHDLPILENSDAAVSVASPFGKFGIAARDGGVELTVTGNDAEGLFLIRENLVEHLEHFLPQVAQKLRWSDGPAIGSQPPNLHLAEVTAKQQLCQDFVRVTLNVPSTDFFSDGAIHFRFVLPHPDDQSPQWPTLKENGALNWPKGDKELHRPVYTVAAFHAENSTVDVDIFQHPGGRVTAWSASAQTGDRVALLGPAGGSVIGETNLLLCGDETAYPAIGRIITALSKDAQGHVYLLSHSGAQDYPLPTHPSLTVHWLHPKDGAFSDKTFARFEKEKQPYLWFAAHADHVKRLRTLLKPRNLPKGRSYLGTFWH
ncbi:siderophore-interacting protein [Loktanella sp. S4079]|uniref:siderophore-interacting protein n=1 Tax=Loktanella sp. S4079 TaxID=579483 RepID=UPI000696A751|nr:siderophore-interacting protein [Loktanella sp. S4079]